MKETVSIIEHAFCLRPKRGAWLWCRRLLAVSILAGLVPCAAAATADPPHIQKGIAYTSWWGGGYQQPRSDASVARLASTGADWVGVLVTCYQHDTGSTEIFPHAQRTPTDEDLIHVIGAAKTLGLNVMLKPHVDLLDGNWRGFIGGVFNDDDWAQWFASYELFIEHYAQLAAAHGVDLVCVGTELVTATVGADRTPASAAAREAQWRAVIDLVGGIYSGPLTYAANHGGEEMLIPWWDALDFIGVDAYYELVSQGNTDPTLGELLVAWTPRVNALSALSAAWDKPILLTEIGYRSVDGACARPWLWGTAGQPDREEQALAYEAAFLSLLGTPWFAGMYWWNWSTDPLQGAGYEDTDYTPHHKPAEAVVRTYYGGPAAPMLAVECVATDSAPMPGVTIACNVEADNFELATNFSLTLDHGTQATLTAPLEFAGKYLLCWQDDEHQPVTYTSAVTMAMDADKTVKAVYAPTPLPDADGNRCVNVSDLIAVRVNLGKEGSDIDPPAADIDRNGIVNVTDYVLVRTSLGEGCQ